MRNLPLTDTVQSLQSVPYDTEGHPWNRGMPNPFGAIGSEYARARNTSGSNSSGTFTTVPIVCFRCDNSLATTRCYECSSLLCYDCCHKIISKCQLREHKLLPIYQQPSNGVAYRAMAMSKAYEKKSMEAGMQIKRNMHCYAQTIGDNQNYLFNEVETMRHKKKKEFTEHINELRDLLTSLAYIIQTLVRSMDCKGINLFMAKEYGRSQVEHISFIFKDTHIPKESIDIMPPNYELFNRLKVQSNVQSTAAYSGVSINSDSVGRNTYQPLRSMQLSQAAQLYPNPNYIARTSNMRMPQDYSLSITSTNNHKYTSSLITRSNTTTVCGIGRAIPAYRTSVSLKPNRSSIPGEPIFSFGPDGQGEGQVSRPWGICIDRKGNMIVADRRNHRIQIFSHGGDFRTMFVSKGTGPGEFDLPAGITTDVFDRIIVADKDNHRVQIFSMNGNFILEFGSFGKRNGQFRYPWDVAVNTIGNIVVTDTLNHRIQLFTSAGRYISKFVFDRAHPTAMLKSTTIPRGVCFTTTGNIAVSDFQNHRILIVDSTLSKVLYRVWREDYGLRELDRPSGIVTDDEGHIIVADSKKHRLLVFTSELRLLATKYLKSPDLDDSDRPSDVALTPEGHLVVLFETRPIRETSLVGKHLIKVY
ncbi:unnamed protein product [Diatraea saccharalis]|uniref:B box-type domain-containing protein n=1 Tax=Diatraea saccharalis TaxID=40085 RepID=A0A9N9RFU5_9NEOP|nr:unnamed protein product [Diatraea saccharalis]